jgi:hypothetical protein
MSGNGWCCAVACAALVASAGVSWATSPEPRNAWLMRNYRFTGPPPPHMVKATDPALADLRQVQNTVLAIMRKADFVEDYGTALDAATVAAGNAQLMEAITSGPVTNGPLQANSDAPVNPVVCQNCTGGPATWSDGLMMHYVTPQGTHVQVRLDLADRALPTKVKPAGGPQRE